jgi:ribosomal protein RSM22 (predicted rRNA methylase)
VLRSGKEYISQKYSENLQQELEQELKRIQETENNQKRLSEIKLQEKFKTFVDQNPQFIESIKAKHSTFVTSTELFEKVAFEEFKSLSLEN